MSHFWSGVKEWLEAIAHICVVAGIVFAVVQYFTVLQTNKQQAAVSYILNFQSEDLVKSRLNLQRNWFDYPVSEITGKSGSSDVVDDLALSFIFPEGKPPNTDDLMRVIGSLDLIGTCVAEQVCDGKTVKKHFGTYVRDLNCLYQAPLERLRKVHNLKQLGMPMRVLIDNKKAC